MSDDQRPPEIEQEDDAVLDDQAAPPEDAEADAAVTAEEEAAVAATEPVAEPKKRRRNSPWLWCLLVLLVALAVPIFWYAYRVYGTAAREQLTAQARARLGVVEIESVGPRWLRQYLGPKNLRDVVGVTVPANADDEFIRRYVVPVGTIRSLCLGGKRVTDDGVARLASLAGLEEVNVSGTSITDAGLTSIARLPRLKRLALARTAITDEGLSALEVLSNLEALDVRGTWVTQAAVEQLRSRRPELQIECRDQGP